MAYIRLLYLEASIDMHTAACLYLETEPCTKKRFGESDRQTERTSTKKRHFSVDMTNVVNISFCMSHVACLEPRPKEHYDEGDRKTVRKNTKKRHCHPTNQSFEFVYVLVRLCI